MEDTFIISADNARERAMCCNTQATKLQLKEISDRIKADADNGKTSSSFSGTILPQVSSELSELGYEIERGSQYNESYYIVRW